MVTPENEEEFDPRVDLLDRYREMTSTQIERIARIDRKAASIARIVGVIGGLVLTAVSVAGDRLTPVEPLAGRVAVALGVVGLFATLFLSVLTYLSNRYVYGPGSEFGAVMAEQDVTESSYKKALLRGYSQAIRDNERVVTANSARFRRSLAALLVSLIYVFTAILIGVIDTAGWRLFGGASVAAGGTAWYVLTKRYLTLTEA